MRRMATRAEEMCIRDSMYTVGTVVDIRHVLRLPDNSVRVLIEGECRAILLDVEERGDMQRAALMVLKTENDTDADSEAAVRRQACLLYTSRCV